jgi:hypothetical protein
MGSKLPLKCPFMNEKLNESFKAESIKNDTPSQELVDNIDPENFVSTTGSALCGTAMGRLTTATEGFLGFSYENIGGSRSGVRNIARETGANTILCSK